MFVHLPSLRPTFIVRSFRPAAAVAAAALLFLAASGPARAIEPITVYVSFEGSGLTPAEQKDLIDRIMAKYDHTVDGYNPNNNLLFINGDPPKGAVNPHVVCFDGKTIGRDYGDTRGNRSVVSVKKLTKGHLSNIYNDPTDPKSREKIIKTLGDTAAHELGHQFIPGDGHNCDAPATADTWVDKDKHTAERTPGNGTLVDGHPGLMARGDKVTPAERMDDSRSFTDDELKAIAKSMKTQQLGGSVLPSDTPHRQDRDFRFIRGIRFNPEHPDLSVPQPFPADSEDSWLDLNIHLRGNSAFDFGHLTRSGSFFSVIPAGTTDSMLSYEPGAVVDFAIHPVGQPDSVFYTLSQYGVISALGGPVAATFSAMPIVSQTYYQTAEFQFKQGVDVSLSNDNFHRYDGFHVTSVPEGDSVRGFLAGLAGLAVMARLNTFRAKRKGRGASRAA